MNSYWMAQEKVHEREAASTYTPIVLSIAQVIHGNGVTVP